MLDRTIAPHIKDAVDFSFKLPVIEKATLQNGLPLYWLNAGVQDVVEIDWVFPAGIWYETKPGIAAATAALLKSGTSTRSSLQINEAFEFYGANLSVSCSNDYVTVSLFTLTKHLEQLLPIVRDILQQAVFPQEELDLYKQNTIQKLMVNRRKCEFIANQKIDAALFGEDHPYGRYSKKEHIETLEQEEIIRYYASYYNLTNARLFMSGKVGQKEVQLIDKVLGKEALVQKSIIHPTVIKKPSTEKKQFIANDENGVQGAIRIARDFVNRHHEDFTPMVILNTLFGGYFGSRLMGNIREDKGFTYGIYSSQASLLHGGSLVVQTEVGKHVIEPAMKEIYKEMKRLYQEAIPTEELLLVKNYLLGNLLGSLDGPFEIIKRWRGLILNDFDETYFYNNIARYKNITAQELQTLAEKYFQQEDFYEIVVV